MAHEVFISHARKDRRVADAICEKLESASVRCWIAERDISADEDWTEATRNAIGSSRVMVLVLSENANVAPHIEREIAHAFYTRRIIIPVRLTKTVPRRAFLFYLGNVSWLDAFSPPAEQQLEALTASVNGLVRGRTVTRDAMPPHSATKTTTLNFSDSWIGALRASHYRTLEILKRATIAVSILAAIWLLWLVHGQTQHEVPPASNPPAMYSGHRASPGLSPQVTGEALVSKPAYTYTRFGLWVVPNTAPTPSVQEGPQDTLPATPERQPVSATSSPHPDVDQKATGDAESLRVHDDASAKSVQEDPSQTTNRREGQRGKSRPKSHNGKARASARLRVADVKSRLKALGHQILARIKEIENR
jgi:TIR domain